MKMSMTGTLTTQRKTVGELKISEQFQKFLSPHPQVLSHSLPARATGRHVGRAVSEFVRQFLGHDRQECHHLCEGVR